MIAPRSSGGARFESIAVRVGSTLAAPIAQTASAAAKT
jgi:hypothetical protein